MMKTPTFLSLAVLMSGCAPAPPDIDCSGPITKITLSYVETYNMVKVQAAPKRAEVDPDDVIRFKINGSLGNLVTVSGKASDSPDSDWISGSGTSGSFYVCVPKDAVRDRIYEYDVVVDDIGTLDPEVRIKKN